MRTLTWLLGGFILATVGCSEDAIEAPKFDGGDVGVIDAGLPDLPANLKSIFNADYPGCKSGDAFTYCQDANKPHMAAARLTPKSYPFTIYQGA